MRRPGWTASRGSPSASPRRRGGGLEVVDQERDAPQARRPVGVGGDARALRRLDHLEDQLAHPEEGLAARAPGRVALAQAAQVEAGVLEHGGRAVEVGRDHDEVVDRARAVRVRARRRPAAPPTRACRARRARAWARRAPTRPRCRARRPPKRSRTVPTSQKSSSTSNPACCQASGWAAMKSWSTVGAGTARNASPRAAAAPWGRSPCAAGRPGLRAPGRARLAVRACRARAWSASPRRACARGPAGRVGPARPADAPRAPRPFGCVLRPLQLTGRCLDADRRGVGRGRHAAARRPAEPGERAAERRCRPECCPLAVRCERLRATASRRRRHRPGRARSARRPATRAALLVRVRPARSTTAAPPATPPAAITATTATFAAACASRRPPRRRCRPRPGRSP